MTPLLKSSALAVALTLGGSSVAFATTFTSGSLTLSNLATLASWDATTDLSTEPTTLQLDPAFKLSLATGLGDFSGLSASGVTFGPTLSLTTPASFNFNAGPLGSFVANSVIDEAFNPATKSFSFIVRGTYTIGSDFTNAGGTLSGDEALSLTQVGGPDTSISINGTFFSPEVLPPPPPSSPEPMTISLFGAGLAALGLVRRRRK